MSKQPKPTLFESSKAKWEELLTHKDIATYVTMDLYRKIDHIVRKLDYYLTWANNSSHEYFFLDYWPARIIGESILLNILPIAEILELNKKYLPKLKTLNSLESIDNQPLLVWYIIATYMKHSYKPYLPYDANIANMTDKQKYEFIFNKYSQSMLFVKTDLVSGSLADEWKAKRVKAFQDIYYKWYDYLYVRFFGKSDIKANLIKKMEKDKLALTSDEKERLKKWNKGRKSMVEDMYGFFKWLYKVLTPERQKPIKETYIYNNASELWNIYKRKNS